MNQRHSEGRKGSRLEANQYSEYTVSPQLTIGLKHGSFGTNTSNVILKYGFACLHEMCPNSMFRTALVKILNIYKMSVLLRYLLKNKVFICYNEFQRIPLSLSDLL